VKWSAAGRVLDADDSSCPASDLGLRFGAASAQGRHVSRNIGSDSVRIVLNLEIPHQDHLPSGRAKRLVLSGVAGKVALDLGVPVAALAARLPLARVTVPERPRPRELTDAAVSFAGSHSALTIRSVGSANASAA